MKTSTKKLILISSCIVVAGAILLGARIFAWRPAGCRMEQKQDWFSVFKE